METNPIKIYVPDGLRAVFTKEDGQEVIIFHSIEPKEEPKLPMSLGELGKIDGYSTYSLVWPTEEESNAARAFSQLLQLRNSWGGTNNVGYPIDGNITKAYAVCLPTKDLRDRFQTQFADLIKTASPLL